MRDALSLRQVLRDIAEKHRLPPHLAELLFEEICRVMEQYGEGEDEDGQG